MSLIHNGYARLDRDITKVITNQKVNMYIITSTFHQWNGNGLSTYLDWLTNDRSKRFNNEGSGEAIEKKVIYKDGGMN